MRKINFRVWDNEGYMSKPFTLHELQAGLIQFTLDCPVMQYTGLEDGYDNEIYEGDIVEGSSLGFGDHFIDYVKFENGSFCFSKEKWKDGTFHWCSLENYDSEDLTVIGNIYQNLELLGEGE